MKKKTERAFRPIPVQGRAISASDLFQDAVRRQREAFEYVSRTGLCFACKKNKVETGELRCEECKKRTEETLQRLRGNSGFMEIRMR